MFSTATGKPQSPRNALRGLKLALAAAGLADRGLTLHDLRHSFASMLIAEGLDPVYVSRQLGHANEAITLGVYGHLYDRGPSEGGHRGARRRGPAWQQRGSSRWHPGENRPGGRMAEVVDMQELRRRCATS